MQVWKSLKLKLKYPLNCTKKEPYIIFGIIIEFYLVLKTKYFCLSFISPKRRLEFRRKCLVQKTHAYVLHRDTGLPHPCWRKKRSSYRRFWFWFHGQFSQKHQTWYIITFYIILYPKIEQILRRRHFTSKNRAWLSICEIRG